jgi:hypothetical protein
MMNYGKFEYMDVLGEEDMAELWKEAVLIGLRNAMQQIEQCKAITENQVKNSSQLTQDAKDIDVLVRHIRTRILSLLFSIVSPQGDFYEESI